MHIFKAIRYIRTSDRGGSFKSFVSSSPTRLQRSRRAEIILPFEPKIFLAWLNANESQSVNSKWSIGASRAISRAFIQLRIWIWLGISAQDLKILQIQNTSRNYSSPITNTPCTWVVSDLTLGFPRWRPDCCHQTLTVWEGQPIVRIKGFKYPF